MHTDLNDEIVSKKSLLRQNGLHLNREGLEIIVRYSPSLFLSTFQSLGIFFLQFLSIECRKLKKSSKIVVYLLLISC